MMPIAIFSAVEKTFLILQLLHKYGPKVAAQAKELLNKETVSDDDWKSMFSMAQEPWVEMKPKD